jgi:hypothetical protein
MKVLYTVLQLQDFESAFKNSHEYLGMRYGQALMNHFLMLENEDFGTFNMFYTESDSECRKEAWLHIGEQS